MLAAQTASSVLLVSLIAHAAAGEAWRPHYSDSVLKVCIGKPISSVGEAWQAALHYVTVRAAKSWRSWASPTQPAEAAPVAANVFQKVFYPRRTRRNAKEIKTAFRGLT